MNWTQVIEEQSILQPGEPGYWKVWGARPGHIRSGDVVLLAPDGEFEFVEETFTAKASPVRVGLVINGERCTIGRCAR